MQPLVVAVQQPEVVLVPLVVGAQEVAHVEEVVQAEQTNPLETQKGKVLRFKESLSSFRNVLN